MTPHGSPKIIPAVDDSVLADFPLKKASTGGFSCSATLARL